MIIIIGTSNMANYISQICFMTIYASLFIQVITSEKHVALFIFGDSLFDAGTNNYINTSLTANFYPYGETFFKHPTGRASDGRLIPDFIAQYAGLPFISPYLQPGKDRLVQGSNFASSGAGALVETHRGSVVDLKTQLKQFQNVGKLLKHEHGKAEARKIISNAVYLFSVGTNDYFFLNSPALSTHSTQRNCISMVIGNLTDVVKGIHNEGGRKFGFMGLFPIGCIPKQRLETGACNTRVNKLARQHNKAFSRVLKNLQNTLKGFKYSNFDFYSAGMQRIKNPSKYGFKEGRIACCGSGPDRGISSCAGRGGAKYELCGDPRAYVFFDSAHPSEKADEQFAELAWNGTLSLAAPYNFEALFKLQNLLKS